ncbi:ATP-binding cassette sub-family B member 10 [Basidiobolus meristosporus CBS 931.73]|uniref:ATP-binding cassette sub-family B member 10 n=1 Tax=Basidiobolus meristosporus CBS 931.73 TaxID=1314790 RepID=A0A1Y1XTU7_9FUNG|nr:ATP-binding cassette sub-family B member 10 [Basidiobolus meristosporus CBS 931.73]|eukprot:ORX89182.1 ATP-binding cassette sub-family B member 10 [Basidiobolus meristosporus CBS 931.73]
MGKIIDIVTESSKIPFDLELTQFFALLGGVFACGALANIGRIVLIRVAGEKVIARLRTNLYDSIMKKDMTFFDANRSGDLISRLSLDTAVVGKTISNNISDGLRSIITATAGLSTMIYVSGKLTLTMMMIVPPIALGGVFYGRYVKELSRKTQDALGTITKVAEERVGNIRTVQAFVRENDEVNRYEMRVQDVFDLAKKEAMANGFFFGGTGMAGNLTILALLGLGGRMVMDGSITVGQLTSFMLYTAYVGSSLMGLTNFYSEVMKGIGASTRLFELMDQQPGISLEGGKILADVKGEITFKNVQFAYPTRPGNEIFKDLTFTVEPGKMMAITGSSGGGKSTVSSLLLRYYDPLHGSILIDGHDIRTLNLRWLREQIGIVSQEPALFAGTVGENIAYGKKGATREEIEEAARQANCNFIENFKDGFDTYVGERGISLSGGQKQRIAIARALLKNPRILILDEATSALDGESEYLVQEALDRLTLNRTTLTIAHRISTIRISDVVICLQNGRVQEEGTFYELSQKENGLFRKLMERQIINNSDQ